LVDAAKFQNQGQTALKSLESGLGAVNAALSPFSAPTGTTPYWNTGARALLMIGGKPTAICTSLSYNLSYNAEEIRTIDSNVSFDIDIGALTIRAQLNTIVDPTAGPEFYSLFATMASSSSQPLVEMQVLDAGTGTSIFFARGIFNSVGFNTGKGQVSSFNASFVGIAFQHYVDQSFVQYSATSEVGAVFSAATNALSGLTGGIL